MLTGVEPNCSKPSIEKFPRPLMTQTTRIHGGLVVHVLVTLYMFLALAIVCDDYFLPSLELLSDILKLEKDVAGATLMAAGSSAPELATSMIGVFLVKVGSLRHITRSFIQLTMSLVFQDDIGLGAVVGSAVFNVAFVVSICGLFSGQVVPLRVWPLLRDSLFYLLSIAALMGVIANKEVSCDRPVTATDNAAVAAVRNVVEANRRVTIDEIMIRLPPGIEIGCSSIGTIMSDTPCAAAPNMEYRLILYPWIPYRVLSARPAESRVESLMLLLLYLVYIGAMCYNLQAEKWFYQRFPSFQPLLPGDGYKEVLREEEGGMEQEEDEEREHGLTKRFLELISQPILWVLWMTCPDCRTPAWKSWYFITFLVSCVWIGLMTYLLVWMITIIGFTLSISDTVMALSLLAAGVSVPDAIASYLVVKKGLGDMAISNAVGSNVFDILLCMGLPWFVQTVAITPGQSVKVQSEATIDCPGLTYSTIALFSTVLFLVLTTHFNGWKLDRKHGFLMMGCYLGFMAFSLATEMATTTIPTCHSDY
ncbi:hypothetical protein LAZ67_1002677 [Cordylochernes scorpioides]|uniref:Sodium/calcium exchanger membrane region domain-containing protein n=1 Tax=Cordylochernes scorpioides TaxID=51811 RepID=A0ABY6JWL7_9ARAC|nr:hypothetical protein LAZ67_1002677 [Cordylochernes scorpioides]